LHTTSSHSDPPRQLGSKGRIYEVTYSIDFSSKVDALSKEFDQLLCMNKMATSSSMQDECSICASPMHASFEHPSIGQSDVVTEQVNAAKDFLQPTILTQIPIIMVGRIILTFLGCLKMWRTHKPKLVDLHLLVFKTKGMPNHHVRLLHL